MPSEAEKKIENLKLAVCAARLDENCTAEQFVDLLDKLVAAVEREAYREGYEDG